MHGEAVGVAPADTAFAARRTQWDFDLIGQWADAAESASHIAWVKSLWGRLDPHLLGSAYINHCLRTTGRKSTRVIWPELRSTAPGETSVRSNELVSVERQYRSLSVEGRVLHSYLPSWLWRLLHSYLRHETYTASRRDRSTR